MNKREALISAVLGNKITHQSWRSNKFLKFIFFTNFSFRTNDGGSVDDMIMNQEVGYEIYREPENGEIERLFFVQNEEIFPKLTDTINELIDVVNEMKARER